MADEFFRALRNTVKRMIDMGDGTHAEQTIAHPPFDLLTDGGDGPNRRMRVDQGSTGFYAGREFRAQYEFSAENEAGNTSIGAGTTRLMRVTVPLNVILQTITLNVDAGAVRVSTWQGGSVTGGVWDTSAMPVFAKNNMSDRPTPFYVSPLTFDIATAGTYNKDGTRFAVLRQRTASASGQTTSVAGRPDLPRGIPVSIFYILMDSIGTGAAQGTIEFEWEDRP